MIIFNTNADNDSNDNHNNNNNRSNSNNNSIDTNKKKSPDTPTPQSRYVCVTTRYICVTTRYNTLRREKLISCVEIVEIFFVENIDLLNFLLVRSVFLNLLLTDRNTCSEISLKFFNCDGVIEKLESCDFEFEFNLR